MFNLPTAEDTVCSVKEILQVETDERETIFLLVYIQFAHLCNIQMSLHHHDEMLFL